MYNVQVGHARGSSQHWLRTVGVESAEATRASGFTRCTRRTSLGCITGFGRICSRFYRPPDTATDGDENQNRDEPLAYPAGLSLPCVGRGVIEFFHGFILMWSMSPGGQLQEAGLFREEQESGGYGVAPVADCAGYDTSGQT